MKGVQGEEGLAFVCLVSPLGLLFALFSLSFSLLFVLAWRQERGWESTSDQLTLEQYAK
jgi:hypothetical protein